MFSVFQREKSEREEYVMGLGVSRQWASWLTSIHEILFSAAFSHAPNLKFVHRKRPI
jgi:hypothetical protein